MQIQEIISSGLLELYAAGLTSKEETEQVEQWIKKYPAIAVELDEINAGIEMYAQSQAIVPAAVVKEKVFAEINATENKTTTEPPAENASAKIVQIPTYWKWIAAASILLLIGSLIFNFTIYNKYNEADKNLQQAKDELAATMDSNNSMKEDMGIVQSKYSEPVSLHGMGVAPDAAAKIFWMKNTGEVYVDPSNLPDIQQGKQFQLWAIVDGKPVDAGMILTSKKGDKYRIQKMKSFGKADAFAITIEKEGGNPTPTMDKMVVMGKM